MTKRKAERVWVPKPLGETDSVASPSVTGFLSARVVHALTAAFGRPVDKRYQKLYGRLTPPQCHEVVCFSDETLLAVKGIGRDGLERIKDLRHYLIHGELRRKVSTPSRAGKKRLAPRTYPGENDRSSPRRIRAGKHDRNEQAPVPEQPPESAGDNGSKQKAYRASGELPKTSFGNSSTQPQDE